MTESSEEDSDKEGSDECKTDKNLNTARGSRNYKQVCKELEQARKL
jgi:hypothetical protein